MHLVKGQLFYWQDTAALAIYNPIECELLQGQREILVWKVKCI